MLTPFPSGTLLQAVSWVLLLHQSAVCETTLILQNSITKFALRVCPELKARLAKYEVAFVCSG